LDYGEVEASCGLRCRCPAKLSCWGMLTHTPPSPDMNQSACWHGVALLHCWQCRALIAVLNHAMKGSGLTYVAANDGGIQLLCKSLHVYAIGFEQLGRGRHGCKGMSVAAPGDEVGVPFADVQAAVHRISSLQLVACALVLTSMGNNTCMYCGLRWRSWLATHVEKRGDNVLPQGGVEALQGTLFFYIMGKIMPHSVRRPAG
jgi:hypothetical protein